MSKLTAFFFLFLGDDAGDPSEPRLSYDYSRRDVLSESLSHFSDGPLLLPEKARLDYYF